MISIEDWKRAARGEEILVEYVDFERRNQVEILKYLHKNNFKLSLEGRKLLSDEVSSVEPLYQSSPLPKKFSFKKRLKNSLSNSELDIPSARIITRPDSKLPLKKSFFDLEEEQSIEEMLKNNKNYSIEIGSIFGSNLHLIVIDIDLKKDFKFECTARRLVSLFEGYYIVATPSKGYHIYVKVQSEEKFKSQNLMNLVGEEKLEVIEILAERKKVVGPGSVVSCKMYEPIGERDYDKTLSFKSITREEFISKLEGIGLTLSMMK